jgi:hypothetical protein
MQNDAIARQLVEHLRSDESDSAVNLADRIISVDRDLAVLTMLQLASVIARSDFDWS